MKVGLILGSMLLGSNDATGPSVVLTGERKEELKSSSNGDELKLDGPGLTDVGVWLVIVGVAVGE